MDPILALGILVSTGAMFFFFYWVFIRLAWRRLTPVDQAEIIRRQNMKKDRRSLQERFQVYIRQYTGLKGSFGPLIYGWLIAVAAAFAGGVAAGLGLLTAVVVSLPISFLIVLFMAKRTTRMRKTRFERQLMTAMALIATQLEAGGGLKRSFERVIEVVEDPLQGEMITLLNQVESGSTMVEATIEMGRQFPSSAMKLFVAALEADAASPGGRLAPVLQSIGSGLEKQFELRAEAEAEIAQSKYQFYGIVGGLTVIGLLMFNMGGAQTRSAFMSPVGLLIMIPILSNAVFGVWRIMRMFNVAKTVN